MNPIQLLEEINVLDLHFRKLFFNKVVINPTEYGLKLTAARCLLVIYFNPDSPMNEVAQQLDIEKGSLTPIAKKLETLGLVKRVRSLEDNRVSVIKLTPNGNKQAKIILQGYTDHIEEVFNTISTEDRRLILEQIGQLNKILNAVALSSNNPN